jgi:hypothetical protein
MRRWLPLLLLGCLLLPAAALAHSRATVQAPNLVKDGGFEAPNVGTSYQLFSTAQSFTSWRVVGAPGTVAPISGKFTQGPFTFNAQSGNQWIDLTGTSNTATGISQSVATKKGKRYKLSFAVGNVSDPGGIFGTKSTVNVSVNGHRLISAVNSASANPGQAWKTFTVAFRATSTRTLLAFINADPKDDNSDGLDSVTLVAVG